MCIRDRCKLSHGRLTRWILALQEYHITWEYIPGRKNVAADVLSRTNVTDQTFEGEKEKIVKVFCIITVSYPHLDVYKRQIPQR